MTRIPFSRGPVHDTVGQSVPGNIRTTYGVNLRSHLEVPEINRSTHPADPWRWVETRPNASPLGVSETQFAVANGYLGMRGNPEEGRDSAQHGTFVNGFHETWHIQHAEDAYGLAREGQTMIQAPDTKTIRIYVDDEPLRLCVADLEHYERSIDFRDGILRREVVWRTPAGKKVVIRTSRMVSMVEKHLAVMTYEIELPDEPAPVVISSQVLNRQDGENEYSSAADDGAPAEGFDPRRAEGLEHRVLEPQVTEDQGGYHVHGYRCTNSGMTIAVAVDHLLETEDDVAMSHEVDDDSSKIVYHAHVTPGRVLKLTKLAAYHTSEVVPASELADRCSRTLGRARVRGVEDLHRTQRDWYDHFWDRADVEVEGPAETQQAIRFNLFQLAQASARAEYNGIAAKGVTGSGYSGHYFWDTETYVLPFLTYTMPRFARNALRFRYNMLDKARNRAKYLSVKGALYPWRTINGEEASAYYEAGTAQYHINADIAHAMVKYMWATEDQDFMIREGVDVLVETARMWVSLGFFDGDGMFHIHGVTGPDEYTTVVDNNLFTNAMARFNLVAAAIACKRIAALGDGQWEAVCRRLKLRDDETSEWRRAADNMVIAFDEDLKVHPQDQDFLAKEVWDQDLEDPRRPLLLHFHPLVIYRHQVLKQADVVLAMFLRGDEFTEEEKRANFEYYDPLTTGDSTLSAVVQSIIAAEIGYCDEAFEHFSKALVVDLADVHGNAADGIHVASTGGVWSALVSGFGGMRDYRGEISFDPRVPAEWTGLTFRLTVRGTHVRVRCTHTEITIENLNGADFACSVQGQPVTVPAGRTMSMELDARARVCLPCVDAG
ncbi:glycoside hydrolase family 65 protein [Dietzia maris]|uniref:glycoside hydrolase family 65 protein n=1 Tax=Dietzia maris TaxID=37915 RepID=UPI00223B416E|nr:glycosyl hydrolase family 65 protein [Dietzia maris]MCT1434763.1 glycoside hydrolase family 65 protein [Dietzia maris]MCT1521985.1 glycoside hydrolase family 65 protein [Dietzia maris]